MFWHNHSHAVDLYKYKNSAGHWVYTDKKPSSANYQQKKMVVTERSEKVSVVNRGSSQRPQLYAVNRLAGPAQIWLELKRADNIKLHPSSVSEWVIEGPSERFLAYVSPIAENRSWAYQWVVHYAYGQPMLKPPEIPPVPSPFSGGPFVISQAFHGEASHNQAPESFYAVDIPMPEGVPIRAVFAGHVMDTERDFSRSGWSLEYADEANFVRILHDDGTMAVYAHLKPESLTVGVGQPVKSGDIIGVSGNTGYSTGPHLHFALQYNAGKQLKSVPFTFSGFQREPKAGDVLRQ